MSRALPKRWLMPLSLVTLLLVLVGIATWDDWKTRKEDAAHEASRVIAAIPVRDVNEISVISRVDERGQPLSKVVESTAVRQDAKWVMVRQPDLVADVGTIQEIVDTIRVLKIERKLEVPKNRWSEFGLAPSRREIRLRWGGLQPGSMTVLIGDKTPIGYSCYFAIEGQYSVMTAGQHLYQLGAKSLDRPIARPPKTKKNR